MAEATALVWLLVIVIVIEGVWLAGLTYLMWHGRAKKARQTNPPQSEEPPKAT